MQNILNPKLKGIRARLDEAAKDLHELAVATKSDELASTMSELRNRLHEPFMFVIVGEVKAGKSSFVNALLATGEEVTKVAPQPMTDTIQQILYGEEAETITINPYLKQILLPVDILKEIAIVDTPGTNTIVEHHQEITERFIPASDLIVFVFEAKNPYRQSAWEFFDFISQDWHKKVIFVLQQKDLMTAEDLKINEDGVRDQASKKGLEDPLVFSVSALQEQEGHSDSSGFAPLRDYISTNITGGQAPLLKLQNNLDTCQRIAGRIQEGIDMRHRQYEADIAFRQDINETLDQQEVRSKKQVDVLVENLLAGYDRITLKKGKELNSGLSFFPLLRRSIASVFSSKASAADWLEQLSEGLENELEKELRTKLDEGVGDLAESIQQMAKLIDLKIRTSESILKNDHELFSDIAERRERVLLDVQEEFNHFINKTESFMDSELFPDKQALSPNVATGSGIAVAGVILATVVQGAVFDITGGILTTIGLIFAGFSTTSRKKKIWNRYQQEIQRGRTELEREISEKLKAYIEELKRRIDSNFSKFDRLLTEEAKSLEALDQKMEGVSSQLAEVGQEIEQA